jgi:hypothetical protein
MARNVPRGTPARVLILFALLAGAVIVSALRDSRRPGVATIRYPTAVGDADFHKPGTGPLQIAVSGTIFTLNEQPAERLQRRDDLMFRVPLAVPVPRLYTTSESFHENSVPSLYLKTAHGEYLKVELRKEATAEPAAGPLSPPGPSNR